MIAEHEQEQRYSRHLSLEHIGEEGQQKLAQARVLVIGVGGLGCPASLYLTASGIGTLGLVDDDRVALSNLNRQILFETADVGRLKTQAAADRLEELNPDIKLELHSTRLTLENAQKLIESYDIILDGSDNLETRYRVNATCHRLKKPLISAAIHGWEGQLYRFDTAAGTACYQCLYPAPPHADEVPTCSESGILSPLAGLMGSWQAAEAIKAILGLNLAENFYRLNLLTNHVRHSTIGRDSQCECCS